MTYIENVFVCMAAPLVVALLSLKRGQRAALVFCLAGMGACLLSAYLNTFFARLYQADAVNAATQIAPVVEEIMKLLPLLFFLAVFEPTFARFRLAAVIVAASFATFENICFLTQNGADQILFLLIRGFGTGAMHVVCGNVYGGVLRPVWDSRPLRAACLFALLCVPSSTTPSTIFWSAPGGCPNSSPTLSRCPRRCASGCWRGKPRRKYSLIGPSCWTV